MSRYRHALSARDSHILTLRGIIIVLLLLSVGLWWGWKSAPTDLTIHNPPDLRTGSTRAWWEVDPSSVYAFSLYVWQQINRWPSDGENDYRRNLYAYQHFLTPSCQIELNSEYERRRNSNELSQRVRGIYEIPGRGYRPDSVEVLSRDTWVATLDMAIDEQYRGTPVRDLYIRYPMRVVRADVDPQNNPWGLQLDCFAQTPQRLQMPNEGDAS